MQGTRRDLVRVSGAVRRATRAMGAAWREKHNEEALLATGWPTGRGAREAGRVHLDVLCAHGEVHGRAADQEAQAARCSSVCSSNVFPLKGHHLCRVRVRGRQGGTQAALDGQAGGRHAPG